MQENVEQAALHVRREGPAEQWDIGEVKRDSNLNLATSHIKARFS